MPFFSRKQVATPQQFYTETDSDPPLVYGEIRPYTKSIKNMIGMTVQSPDKERNLYNSFCSDQTGFFNFQNHKYKIVFVRTKEGYTRLFLLNKYTPSGTDKEHCAFISLSVTQDMTLKQNHPIYTIINSFISKNLILIQPRSQIIIDIYYHKKSTSELGKLINSCVEQIQKIQDSLPDHDKLDQNILSYYLTLIQNITNNIIKLKNIEFSQITQKIKEVIIKFELILELKSEMMKSENNFFVQMKKQFLQIQNKYINQSNAVFDPTNHNIDIKYIMMFIRLILQYNIHFDSKTNTTMIDRTKEAQEHFLKILGEDLQQPAASVGGYRKTKDKIQTSKGMRCVYLNKKGKKFVKLNGNFVACAAKAH